jgi:hypothetical protein
MSRYFPEYRGDDLDYDAACSFLLNKFSSLNLNPEKSVYAVRFCSSFFGLVMWPPERIGSGLGTLEWTIDPPHPLVSFF